MPQCENCQEKITEEQYKDYMHLCPYCYEIDGLRVKNKSNFESDDNSSLDRKRKMGAVILLIFFLTSVITFISPPLIYGYFIPLGLLLLFGINLYIYFKNRPNQD